MQLPLYVVLMLWMAGTQPQSAVHSAYLDTNTAARLKCVAEANSLNQERLDIDTVFVCIRTR